MLKCIVGIYGFLFEKGSYTRRLWIHLGILLLYSVAFILLHEMVSPDQSIESRNYKQLKLSRLLLLAMLFHLVLVIGIKWTEVKNMVKEYFKESGSSFNLGVFRFIFFWTLSGHLLFYVIRSEISWSYLPYESRVGLPYIGWLVRTIPISPQIFKISGIIAGILSFFVAIGFFTRISVKLLIPFLFYCIGIPMFFGKISHYHILLWVPLFMMFAPMGDSLSIDSLFKARNTRVALFNTCHQRYILPFKFIWLQLAIIYGFAGVIKLWDCGLDWAISDSMIYQIQREWVENYDKVPGFRIDHYPFLAKIGGLGVIYFELLYFLLILKPSTRIWALIGSFGLHKLAGYFMNIDFVNLRIVHFSYLNWAGILIWLRRRLKKKTSSPTESNTTPHGNFDFGMKATVALGAIIVIINFCFSLMRIHTYPFSSYPTYSAIVKNELSLIRMDVYDSTGIEIDEKQIGQQNNFRWENIRPYENRIIEKVSGGDTLDLEVKLNEYWMLWENGNRQLQTADKVVMFIDVTELAPEKRNIILKSSYIGTVYPARIKK